MRRLLTVAVGLALGALTTPADARPSDFTTSSGQNIWYHFDDSPDVSASPGPRRRTAKRSQPRKADTRRHTRRAARPHTRQADRGNRVRSTAFLHNGGGGASRTCLTSSARALLGRIESQFGRVQVISTCRPGARIAGSGRISRHASGNAVDFNAGGRKAAVVRWLIANHKAGGTMTYAGMSHIHVDIGYRFVSLNSGGGRYR